MSNQKLISQFGASLTDDPRVIIYNCKMFIIQATGIHCIDFFLSWSLTNRPNKLDHLSLAKPGRIFAGKGRSLRELEADLRSSTWVGSGLTQK
jgi:hypothetical protein